jgi:Protein of unknown function (DUF3096)
VGVYDVAQTLTRWRDIMKVSGWCATPSAAPARSLSKKNAMNLNLSIGPLVALIAGILILVMPRMLNYIVAFYLIIVGIIGLFGRQLGM